MLKSCYVYGPAGETLYEFIPMNDDLMKEWIIAIPSVNMVQEFIGDYKARHWLYPGHRILARDLVRWLANVCAYSDPLLCWSLGTITQSSRNQSTKSHRLILNTREVSVSKLSDALSLDRSIIRTILADHLTFPKVSNEQDKTPGPE